mmetsp:Transcript_57678/g.134367  ORF Transcript_57678/g.134367 Transcript_57678/m.134367 type:complete len:161 (+) Transcript_57678:105-587(+)
MADGISAVVSCGKDAQKPFHPRRLTWRDGPCGASSFESTEPLFTKEDAEVITAGGSTCASNGDTPTRSRSTASAQGAQVDDRRLEPSQADHTRILSTFQQGLAGVETVILYDCLPQHFEDFDFEESHDVFVARIGRRVCGSMPCCGYGCLEFLGAHGTQH